MGLLKRLFGRKTMTDQPTPPPSPFQPASEPEPVSSVEGDAPPEGHEVLPGTDIKQPVEPADPDVQEPVATDTELELPQPEPASEEPIPEADPVEPAPEPEVAPAPAPEPEKPLKRDALSRVKELRRKLTANSTDVKSLEANLVAAQDKAKAAEEREERFRRSATEWESHSKGLKHQYDELYAAYTALEAEMHALCDEHGID